MLVVVAEPQSGLVLRPPVFEVTERFRLTLFSIVLYWFLSDNYAPHS
jgi:hypothetical protein